MFGPTILLCGFLTDALGRRACGWRARSPSRRAILIFALTRTYRGALVAVVLLGIGWAAQVNVSNVLMRVAVPADGPREQLDLGDEFLRFRLRLRRVRHADGAGGDPSKKLGYRKGSCARGARDDACRSGRLRQDEPPPIAPAPAAGDLIAQEAGADGRARRRIPSSGCSGSPSSSSSRSKRPSPGGRRRWSSSADAPGCPEGGLERFAALGLSAFWFGFTGSRLDRLGPGRAGVPDAKCLGQTNEQRAAGHMGVVCVRLMLGLAFLKGRNADFRDDPAGRPGVRPGVPDDDGRGPAERSGRHHGPGRRDLLLLRVGGLDRGADADRATSPGRRTSREAFWSRRVQARCSWS